VLGVPMKSSALNGLDSLLSIVQMPAGIPVATFAIGEAGAKNAGLFAASILALEDKEIAQQLEQFRRKQTETVLKGADPRA
jgi:5-(carboxyamino)imidazole ribonucleotide mutase